MNAYLPYIIIFLLFLICGAVFEISSKFSNMLNYYFTDKNELDFHIRSLQEELQHIRNTLDEIRLDQV